jgi:LPXTG-motif cell wall-anchored protein
VQALASTGADIAPLVGLIGALLLAGIVLLIAGRRRAV